MLRTVPSAALTRTQSGGELGWLGNGEDMRRLGALIFPGFELLDLYGPLEMFGLLPDDYDLALVALTREPVVSNQQVSAMPDHAMDCGPDFDVRATSARS